MQNEQVMKSQDYINLENIYCAKNYDPLDVVIEKASGVWVEDVDGKKYLDFLAAYSAVNQGHCHPRLTAVMQNQCTKLTLSSRAFRNNMLPLFAKRICEIVGYDMMIPMNSGVEAVETALKLARKWGAEIKKIERDKAEIIVCDGNFHGRTISVISFSTNQNARGNFGPFTPGFKSIPFGDIEALKKAISINTCAFLTEPIQGEGGVIIPPDNFLEQARELCNENNILMIADEIQSGLGRTGKMLACQWSSVRPDMIILGKALSGGMYPISAVLADKHIMGLLRPGDHGSTFGGNPLACAIGIEALNIIVDENLAQRSNELGTYLMESLNKIDSKHVEKYRGRGLWVGIVLKKSSGGARRFCEQLKVRGLLAKETHINIIRLAPPLIITKEEIDYAVKIIKEVLMMA